PLIDGAELAFDLVGGKVEPGSPNAVDLEHEIRIAFADAGNFPDAAAFAPFFQHVANIGADPAQHRVVRPEDFDFHRFVRAGKVAQLVLHDGDRIDLQL